MYVMVKGEMLCVSFIFSWYEVPHLRSDVANMMEDPGFKYDTFRNTHIISHSRIP